MNSDTDVLSKYREMLHQDRRQYLAQLLQDIIDMLQFSRERGLALPSELANLVAQLFGEEKAQPVKAPTQSESVPTQSEKSAGSA